MNNLASYALSFVGTPYRWGGDDPMGGFDCSGLVQEILAAVGEDPPGDQSSHTLYLHFSRYGIIRDNDIVSAGDLAFFGTTSRIIHVTFCIDDCRMIEAGGGGRHVMRPKDAEEHNAYVRVRPINSRSDLVKIIGPNYQTCW